MPPLEQEAVVLRSDLHSARIQPLLLQFQPQTRYSQKRTHIHSNYVPVPVAAAAGTEHEPPQWWS
jgi:hypothetical protein